MDASGRSERLARSQPCSADRVVQRFDPEKWALYRDVLLTAQKRNLAFAAGGGLATMIYAAQTRPSKDLDLFVLSADREAAIQVLTDCGFVDLYDDQPYDRTWIYRGHKEATIIDVIWAMANHRTPVDRVWIEKGPEICIDDVQMRLVPPEETLWAKLYILQDDRCDWPDALSMLYMIAAELDWDRLLARVGEDLPLLAGLLSVLRWLSPGRTRDIPDWVWRELPVQRSENGSCPDVIPRRANLLDSRPWFTPVMPEACDEMEARPREKEIREEGVSNRC